MTAEEFIREKIREKYLLPPKAAMAGLQIYNVTGEDCLRWAHEFSEHSRQSPASLPDIEIFDQYLIEMGIGLKERELIINFIYPTS